MLLHCSVVTTISVVTMINESSVTESYVWARKPGTLDAQPDFTALTSPPGGGAIHFCDEIKRSPPPGGRIQRVTT